MPEAKPIDLKWTEDDAYLQWKVLRRFAERSLPMGTVYTERLAYEGRIIAQTGYAPYFLIVTDLIDFMKANGIRHLVRGSGVGCLHVWGLGISHIWLDPVKYELPFERFLNPARVSMPDLDIDIQDDKRDLVFRYTVDKYGSANVARIISFGTMAAKAACKDVFRAMDVPDYQLVSEKIAGAIPAGKIRLADAIEASELLREMARSYPKEIALAKRVEGKVRHSSIHAAGVVIGPDELWKYMPLYYAGNPESRDKEDWDPATQWDMYDCEKRGLLKMDYLSLKTLKVIDQTVKFINQFRGPDQPQFDIDTVDRWDDTTWKMIAEGRLIGIFQVERSYVRDFARRMSLGIKDEWQLAVILSIIRPGMMDAGMTEVYLKRASGAETSTPLHPAIEGTLKKTYQTMVFQEDLMRVAQKLAGFTMSEADELRRAVGKKLPEEMAKIKPKFLEGCMKFSKLTLQQAEEIWSLIETFGRYGFCAGHAAAYGLVGTYQTAYLKANEPLFYMTSLINSEAGVGDKERGYNSKVAEYVEEAAAMGIKTRRPSVTQSDAYCRPVPQTNQILFGLAMVKGVSESAVEWIIKNCRGVSSFKEFILACFELYQEEGKWKCRSRVGKGHMEALLAAGGFDENGLMPDRKYGLEVYTKLLPDAKKYWEQECKRRNGSTRLKLTPEAIKVGIDNYVIDTADRDPSEQIDFERTLLAEKAVTGCFLSSSPFDPHRDQLKQYTLLTFEQIEEGDLTGGDDHLAGMLRDYREVTCKNGKSKGRKMAFLTFSMAGGDVEVVAFPDAWEFYSGNVEGTQCRIVERGKVYVVGIRADRGGGAPNLRTLVRLSDVNAVAA